MASLTVTVVERRTPFAGIDGYPFRVEVADDGAAAALEVQVSASQSIVAGFGDEGPSAEWVAEIVRRVGNRRLRNDLPVIEQVRGWPSPLVLTADDAL